MKILLTIAAFLYLLNWFFWFIWEASAFAAPSHAVEVWNLIHRILLSTSIGFVFLALLIYLWRIWT